MTIFRYIIVKCDIVKYMPKLIFQFNFNSIQFNFNSIQFNSIQFNFSAAEQYLICLKNMLSAYYYVLIVLFITKI